MAENELTGSVLGVAWDGTGYGPDGTIWGGEFLLATEEGYRRAAHLRPFRLPGGERAVREPRRSCLGLLYALLGDAALALEDLPPVASFTPRERAVLRRVLAQGLNAPLTSSAGRLFDALAALLGVRQVSTFEGQAAMELEWAAQAIPTDESYPLAILGDQEPLVVDWAPMVETILAQVAGPSVPVGLSAARAHNTLVEAIVAVARRVGEERVVLTGGCFQNRYLTERAVRRLREEGFRPYWHQRVPPNDGGIALGQALAARRVMSCE